MLDKKVTASPKLTRVQFKPFSVMARKISHLASFEQPAGSLTVAFRYTLVHTSPRSKPSAE